ncbi:MAG TPA: GNAT family N-acetyltransferase [Polyangiaceae bacterium]
MSDTPSQASARFEPKLLSGPEAIHDAGLISSLAALWAEAYRGSPVTAQRDDPLYTADNEAERMRRIRAELRRSSAIFAYLMQDADLIGFFWGLSVADLQTAEPLKGHDVARFIAHDAEQVAYLSMLGIHPNLTGRGLGKELTRALCAAFTERGFKEAIARTINDLALEKVYRPLGFEIHQRFRDPRSGDAERSIFGSPLPLPRPRGSVGSFDMDICL